MSTVRSHYLFARKTENLQTDYNLHKNFDQSHFALLQHDLIKFSEGN